MPSNLAKPVKISLIAAIGRNRELGSKQGLIWPIPEDLKRFKAITNGHPIVMGLNTYRSIGRSLPGRTNVVLSRGGESIEGAVVAGSLEEALSVATASSGGEEIFIIGGGQVFAEAMPRADKLYLTLIDAEAPADVFFPEYSDFTKKISEESGDYNGLKYSYLVLERPTV
ncbi:dihydrofolate reductase [Candidatus Parcubacteria bacterium]|nr:dihydrofolate reductase [Candidatus Parcubacteria bacterium]